MLTGKLKMHYAPKPPVLPLNRPFTTEIKRIPRPSGNMLPWAVMNCEFRDLEGALRDQLLCRLKNLKLQRRLLAKSKLTLKLALGEVMAVETMDKSKWRIRNAVSPTFKETNCRALVECIRGHSSSEDEVSRLQEAREEKPTMKAALSKGSHCPGCGRQHLQELCRFRDITCCHCNKRGYLAQVIKAFIWLSHHHYRPIISRN